MHIRHYTGTIRQNAIAMRRRNIRVMTNNVPHRLVRPIRMRNRTRHSNVTARFFRRQIVLTAKRGINKGTTSGTLRRSTVMVFTIIRRQRISTRLTNGTNNLRHLRRNRRLNNNNKRANKVRFLRHTPRHNNQTVNNGRLLRLFHTISNNGIIKVFLYRNFRRRTTLIHERPREIRRLRRRTRIKRIRRGIINSRLRTLNNRRRHLMRTMVINIAGTLRPRLRSFTRATTTPNRTMSVLIVMRLLRSVNINDILGGKRNRIKLRHRRLTININRNSSVIKRRGILITRMRVMLFGLIRLMLLVTVNFVRAPRDGGHPLVKLCRESNRITSSSSDF